MSWCPCSVRELTSTCAGRPKKEILQAESSAGGTLKTGAMLPAAAVNESRQKEALTFIRHKEAFVKLQGSSDVKGSLWKKPEFL
ncbi:hypothetical protein cypCar_00046438 [Cyprinus carpio]|nr:hypothetical protein cypCar_00046438 [Cyprinus carpio]